MEKEIKRIAKMLPKKDPESAEYGVLLEHLFTLVQLREYLLPVEAPVTKDEIPATKEVQSPTKVEQSPAYTIEEVRKALIDAQQRGVDPRPFIHGYGVKNLSAIPVECYGDLIIAIERAEEVNG